MKRMKNARLQAGRFAPGHTDLIDDPQHSVGSQLLGRALLASAAAGGRAALRTQSLCRTTKVQK